MKVQNSDSTKGKNINSKEVRWNKKQLKTDF